MTSNMALPTTARLDDGGASRYEARVPTFLAKLALLFAVLLMPLGMAPAAATSAASGGHHMMAGMPAGHCPDQAPANHEGSGIADCAMACASALPAADFASERQPLALSAAPLLSVPAERLHGLHPETATPPPRAS